MRRHKRKLVPYKKKKHSSTPKLPDLCKKRECIKSEYDISFCHPEERSDERLIFSRFFLPTVVRMTDGLGF